ncbi:MAG: hypothetical protein GTN74_08465 [Proteobacteria bacterium]|nr:hypothetical protein [Pseudomonadota bacterium]NIS69864.1 hypothetical protein [Pseudomonadota bacterium]
MKNPKEIIPDAHQSMVKELVDGFVHEVKNPLTSIGVALRALREKTPQGDPNRQLLEQMDEQVGTINRALSDLLDFTRLSPPEAMPTGINNVLDQVLDRIRSECGRRAVKVEKHLTDNLHPIEIDGRQTELAFLHLLLDMLEAMPNGGDLVIRSGLDPDGQIVVEMEDTGFSIQDIHLERLFKPFLSTRGRGAGIGLSMAKRIIELNRGLIRAQKRGEEGMTFSIVFPSP